MAGMALIVFCALGAPPENLWRAHQEKEPSVSARAGNSRRANSQRGNSTFGNSTRENPARRGSVQRASAEGQASNAVRRADTLGLSANREQSQPSRQMAEAAGLAGSDPFLPNPIGASAGGLLEGAERSIRSGIDNAVRSVEATGRDTLNRLLPESSQPGLGSKSRWSDQAEFSDEKQPSGLRSDGVGADGRHLTSGHDDAMNWNGLENAFQRTGQQPSSTATAAAGTRMRRATGAEPAPVPPRNSADYSRADYEQALVNRPDVARGMPDIRDLEQRRSPRDVTAGNAVSSDRRTNRDLAAEASSVGRNLRDWWSQSGRPTPSSDTVGVSRAESEPSGLDFEQPAGTRHAREYPGDPHHSRTAGKVQNERFEPAPDPPADVVTRMRKARQDTLRDQPLRTHYTDARSGGDATDFARRPDREYIPKPTREPATTMTGRVGTAPVPRTREVALTDTEDAAELPDPQAGITGSPAYDRSRAGRANRTNSNRGAERDGAREVPQEEMLQGNGIKRALSDKPWWPLILTVLGLFGSIGFNIYLGWIAWDLYSRCQEAVEDVQDLEERLESKSKEVALA